MLGAFVCATPHNIAPRSPFHYCLSPVARLRSCFLPLQVVQDAQADPFGLQVGGTCLKVVTPPPTRMPTTKSPTRAPTSKGKVAAAAEVVGAALARLRGAAV